jgi:hypothetical protein
VPRGAPIPEPSAGDNFKSQQNVATRFPTRWNPEDKQRGLALSADGYEVRFADGIYLSHSYFLFISRIA